MGTTLTGLTPATTYDALIKVSDNGPLSATAKYVGDGLGNDSVVALSTSSVGIGTTSPTQLLHVAGNVRITGALYDGNNAAGTSGQILSSTGTGTDWVSKSDLSLVDGSGTANYVSKWSDTDTLTNSLIYDNGSAVGIGNTSPAAKLDVTGTVAARTSGVPALQGFRDLDVSVVGSAGQGLELGARDGATYKAGSAIYGTLDNPSTTGNMVFQTRTADALTTKMTITSAGAVGIGTSSPTAKFVALNGVGNGEVAIFGGTDEDRGLSISTFEVGGYGQAGVNLNAQYSLGAALSISTSGTERMRITSAGLVGIGTISPAAKLDVNGGNIHSFYSYGGGGANYNLRIGNSLSATDYGYFSQLGGSTFVANNNYYAVAGQFTPTATSASFISQSAGDISFFANTGLTAGVNYSPTERMKLDSSGNLSLLTGNLALSGAGGIFFDNAASKYLDDYEVGTWTPVLSDGTNNATMDAGTLGSYTKIGRVVYCSFTILTSSLGSVSGNLRVTGLPFAQGGAFGPSAFTSSANQQLNVTAGQFVSGRIVGANTFVELWINNSSAGMTRMQATEWSADGYANFTGYYFV